MFCNNSQFPKVLMNAHTDFGLKIQHLKKNSTADFTVLPTECNFKQSTGGLIAKLVVTRH